jgi:hypothetical protein
LQYQKFVECLATIMVRQTLSDATLPHAQLRSAAGQQWLFALCVVCAYACGLAFSAFALLGAALLCRSAQLTSAFKGQQHATYDGVQAARSMGCGRPY